jgi:uncharacterized protein (TIGR00255 family)
LIKSMTGYGRATRTADGCEITVELRSVNNRYLDCSVKLPRLCGFAEDGVKNRVKQSISRGKVDVFVSVSLAAGQDEKITLNRPVVEGYLEALRAMAKDYGLKDDLTVTALSRLPDVFDVQKEETDEQQLTEDILEVTDEAAKKFDEMRAAEGEALDRDVRSRAAAILSLVEKVEARSPETVKEYRARLTAKMEEVLSGAGVDEARILQEAAIYADKIAVDEETVRLRSHLSQLDSMLTTGGPVGRKLDFLLQELNREANTIGSKCNDLEQTNTVVEIKAELEKIREQIQNIE